MLRMAYLKRVAVRLEDLEDDIDRIGSQAEKAKEEARSKYREQLAILDAGREAVLERIRRLREADARDWGNFKSGAEAALEDLKKAVDTAVSELKKIA